MYVIRMLVKLLVVDPIVLCYACLVDIVRHRLNSVVVRQITKITYPVNGPMFMNQVEVFFSSPWIQDPVPDKFFAHRTATYITSRTFYSN